MPRSWGISSTPVAVGTGGAEKVYGRNFAIDVDEKFSRFGLKLHPDKTRFIEFGRWAAIRRHFESSHWHIFEGQRACGDIVKVLNVRL